MAFVITKKSDYTPAPPGTFRVVVCDVQDLGEVNGQYGTYNACRISFQIDEEMRPGQRFVVGRKYHARLQSKGPLRELLTTLLGLDFDAERFDLEELIGLPCLVAIEQSQGTDGNTYANVARVVPMPRGTQPILIEGYTRSKDREPKLVSQPRHHAAAEKPKNEVGGMAMTIVSCPA